MKIAKGKNLGVGILVIVLSVFGFIYFGQKGDSDNYSTEIEKWDNLYRGNNIKIYYIEENKSEISNLRIKYEVDKLLNEGDDEVLKALDVNRWLKSRCKVSLSTMETNKNAEELLITLSEETIISQKDYNGIMEELLASVGVKSRIGEYRLEESYSIIEVWNSTLNKWVMIDGLEGGYLKANNEPLSAVEVLNSGLENLVFNSEDKEIPLEKSYVKTLKKSLGAYTIKIDNSKYEQSVINSYITYVKSVDDVRIETLKGYIQPTIFVDNEILFNVSPFIKDEEYKGDEIPTIIFAKRSVKEDGENYIKFTVGAFMNSVMIEDFYISVNDGEYIKVDTYYSLSIEEGSNTIKISLDGINPLRTVMINKK